MKLKLCVYGPVKCWSIVLYTHSNTLWQFDQSALTDTWFWLRSFDLISDSRATFTSSFAGSESVFASRETGVSAVPTEASVVDETKILNVRIYILQLTTIKIKPP